MELVEFEDRMVLRVGDRTYDINLDTLEKTLRKERKRRKGETMSGGSMDYAFSKLQTIAEDLIDLESRDEAVRKNATHPLRRALYWHMQDMANVLKDIEWSDSGDSAPDAWEEPVRAYLRRYDPKARP